MKLKIKDPIVINVYERIYCGNDSNIARNIYYV